jgi:hypothetical protein
MLIRLGCRLPQEVKARIVWRHTIDFHEYAQVASLEVPFAGDQLPAENFQLDDTICALNGVNRQYTLN